ncbi:hypothetical protein NDU88_004234 [Pleurodeles waltl]|uniref:Uncharacterized protein n=1 Tax=Pleurodeles waltl TaxID=8319 RepID=A0AAV7NT56_PLEWA|nr:hypothetical protein NDU88_004234 [Pleurodeles waltl]
MLRRLLSLAAGGPALRPRRGGTLFLQPAPLQHPWPLQALSGRKAGGSRGAPDPCQPLGASFPYPPGVSCALPGHSLLPAPGVPSASAGARRTVSRVPQSAHPCSRGSPAPPGPAIFHSTDWSQAAASPNPAPSPPLGYPGPTDCCRKPASEEAKECALRSGPPLDQPRSCPLDNALSLAPRTLHLLSALFAHRYIPTTLTSDTLHVPCPVRPGSHGTEFLCL